MFETVSNIEILFFSLHKTLQIYIPRTRLLFFLCYVDKYIEPHEDFVGLSIESDLQVDVFKDTMLRINLSIRDCRGQGYDNVWIDKGAATRISYKLPVITCPQFGHLGPN